MVRRLAPEPLGGRAVEAADGTTPGGDPRRDGRVRRSASLHFDRSLLDETEGRGQKGAAGHVRVWRVRVIRVARIDPPALDHLTPCWPDPVERSP